MTKRYIEAHPSVVIAYSPEAEKLLFATYDKGYGKKTYRLSANNIGGNPNPKDLSPLDTLKREIEEEFDPNHSELKYGEKVDWASKDDMISVRKDLLDKIHLFNDFYVDCGEIPGGNDPYTAIYSGFYSKILGNTIEIVKRNEKDNKHLSTEGGLTRIFTLEALINHSRGEFSTAHATAPMVNKKFGSKIRYPKLLKYEIIGLPRTSYADYENDFTLDEKRAEAASEGKF